MDNSVSASAAGKSEKVCILNPASSPSKSGESSGLVQMLAFRWRNFAFYNGGSLSGGSGC